MNYIDPIILKRTCTYWRKLGNDLLYGKPGILLYFKPMLKTQDGTIGT